MGSISDALDRELFKLKHIVEFVLELVKMHGVVLDAPCHLLFGFFNFLVVSLLEDVEKFGVDLEVILADLQMGGIIVILFNDLFELFSELVNLNSDTLLLFLGES